MPFPLIPAALALARGAMTAAPAIAGAAAEGGAAAGTAARVLPMAGKLGDLMGMGGAAQIGVSLLDDIPAIASMIMHHGEGGQEAPEIQAKREQEIVAERDKLVAKLVAGGMQPEEATQRVNDQLRPVLEKAKAAQQGDQGGSGIGSVISAGAMLGLPALGAARGGLGAAKAIYKTASAAPSFFGKAGQVGRGISAGQFSLMKSAIMGAPKGPPGMGEQAALNRLQGAQAPEVPPNMAGMREESGQGIPPNFTIVPEGRGRGLPYTPPEQATPPQSFVPEALALDGYESHAALKRLRKGGRPAFAKTYDA